MLVPEYPQNTPRNTEFIPLGRNTACTGLSFLALLIITFLGVSMIEQFFQKARLCCVEKPAGHTQAGLHSLEHLLVTDESFSD